MRNRFTVYPLLNGSPSSGESPSYGRDESRPYESRPYERSSSISGHAVEVTDIFWSPDSTNIVSAGRDGTIQVWKATSGNNFLTYAGSDPVGWSPDDKRIVSGAVFLDHTVQVRDATTGYNTYIYHAYSAQINVLAWSPDSTRIGLAGLD